MVDRNARIGLGLRRATPSVALAIIALVAGVGSAAGNPDAAAVQQAVGCPRGIVALLGDEGCKLATDLARSGELTVFVQLERAGDVAAARRSLSRAGLLNRRIYVEQGDVARLHLAENLADVVVACGGTQGRVTKEEVLRVLRPGGKGLLGSATIVKPAPAGTDDWSHPYHGPDNNPQSTDRRALAPYLTQFLAEPFYCPMPEVTVISGGRIFKAFGSRAFKRPQWPVLNTLIAMNAYNGTLLWKRTLDPDFMIHRSTIVATPDTLYLADATSCKLLDAATGKLKDEITVPADLSDGPVWKWMALEDGTLYALVGEKEPPGDALKGPDFRGAGWPWWKIPKYGWGFGHTLLAIDPATKKVLWQYRDSEPLDMRAMCMRGGRIYFYSDRKFLGCLDAKTGSVVWKTNDPKVLGAIGEHHPAQFARRGFQTSTYVKCNDKALYFAGPQRTKLVAVSAGDGKLLWEFPEGNFQLVLRDDALYAMGSTHPSQKFDLLTGKVLQQLPNRAACTRATGSVDRVFVRGGGTRSWEVSSGKWLHISPMRPACHDGVVVAGGHLYWGPWMCGCNLSLLGIICLRPSGDFNYSMKAAESERLEAAPDAPDKPAPLPQTADDWPTYRKDNARSTCSPQTVGSAVAEQWRFAPGTPNTPTAPVAVGELVLVGGSDGVVTTLDAGTGKPRWTACTGGAIVFPPSFADGRALVGSADGWIYAYEAATGRALWRFRAAPVERTMRVYGRLSSTWPVGSGVVVQDGVAYAAAGIANYDGTHVYALDAATGKFRWQNNTSGNTAGGQGAGASVQGHLLVANRKLYLAGGNRIPVASYALADGTYTPAGPGMLGPQRRGPPGKDLFLRRDGSVVVSGRFPLYARPVDFHYIEQAELNCPGGTIAVATDSVALAQPGAGGQAKPKRLWTSRPFTENVAVAVARNAVLVAGTDRRFERQDGPPIETYGITALGIGDGKPLWRHQLPAGVVSWGAAIDRRGRVLVALRDGRVICLASKS